VQLPLAVNELLKRLSTGEGADFASASAKLAATSVTEMKSLLALSQQSDNGLQAEIALVFAWRAVLSLVPASCLENPRLPCRAVVEGRLAHLLGEPPGVDAVEALLKIVKRLQLYRLRGRSAWGDSGFSIDKVAHVALLERQAHRCSCCGYRFLEEDLDPELYPDGAQSKGQRLGSSDRSPEVLYRRAVLDHALPIYLAGDSSENWQVMCTTCNAGKSDLVLGFEGKEWFGDARAATLTLASPRLFYMVLRRDGQCNSCRRTPLQVEMRLKRLDPNGSDLMWNLVTCCIDCMRSSSFPSSVLV
jgi:5-methylcytosine-specific restriction endonuclease McrA